jgi:hypothetical protein
MNARDGRSVGEILLQADTASRELLFDVSGDDAPAMLRTWGEVVQNAAELWQVLPARSRGDTADGQLMAQLEGITQGMHRTRLRQGWPGDGDPDQRLLGIAEAFGAARDLVAAHSSQRGGVQSLEQARDVHAARTRIMHALYVGAHSVSVAVREHIRDLREMPHVEKQSARATRGIPRGQDALQRLTAFEELAGSYLGGRFARALEGEHREGYAGLDRLSDAIARWDVQAHRTLAGEATAANLAATARTQAMIARTGLILVRAAAHTGDADPVTYEQRIAPALESATRAASRLAGDWGTLTDPATRRVDPDLWAVDAQLQAAMRELIHDKSALADPTLIAQRADLRDVMSVVSRATAAALEVACVTQDIAGNDTSLIAPIRGMLELARTGIPEPGPGDVDELGASLNAADLLHNRVRPLIDPIRDLLIRSSADTAQRMTDASSAVGALWRQRESAIDAPSVGRDRSLAMAPPMPLGSSRSVSL